jgi:uncharacterized protein (AIM24 family)
MGEEKQESVLDALIALERTELAKYCEEISVDGAIAQTATLRLKKGQSLWSSKGCLLAYHGVDWSLKIPGGAGKALGRMMSGEGVTLTRVVANQDDAKVVLTANQPGKLASWDLSRGSIICTSGSFVGALGDVDISVTMARSAGAAFFGGAGLFLQKLSGEGIALVHGSGDFVEQTLGAGESILVSTGNLAVFSAEVSYGVRRTGGCLKSMFGGEGIFPPPGRGAVA